MSKMNKNRVFLGGTCNGSTWRDDMIKGLKVDYFDPVVEDWTPEAQENERVEKGSKCNIHLYVITNKMKGVFSIAEAVDSAHNKKVQTILHIVPKGFKDFELRSLKAVVDLVNTIGGMAYLEDSIDFTTGFLNYTYGE